MILDPDADPEFVAAILEVGDLLDRLHHAASIISFTDGAAGAAAYVAAKNTILMLHSFASNPLFCWADKNHLPGRIDAAEAALMTMQGRPAQLKPDSTRQCVFCGTQLRDVDLPWTTHPEFSNCITDRELRKSFVGESPTFRYCSKCMRDFACRLEELRGVEGFGA